MTTAEFTLTVGQDSDGNAVPAEGTAVGLAVNGPYGDRAERVTDTGGTIEFSDLQGESATLRVCGVEYDSYDISSDVSATVALTPGVYGQVRDADTGVGLAGRTVVASQETHGFSMFTKTNEEGRYTLPLEGEQKSDLLYVDGGQQSTFINDQDLVLRAATETPGVSNNEKVFSYGFSQTVEQNFDVVRN